MSAPTRFPKLRLDAQAVKTHELTATTLSRVQDNISATVDPMASALGATPIMGTQPVWITPSLTGGYLNFGGVYAVAGFYKDSLSRVWSKGVLANAAGAATTVAVFTFPMGYRPRETQRFSVEGNGATAQFISVSADGVVTPEVAVGAGGSLDISFSFLAEQ